MAPKTETRVIVIKSDVQGGKELKDVATSLGAISKQVNRMQSDVSLMTKFQKVLTGMFAFNVLGMGISSFTKMSDSVQLLTDRIKVMEGDGSDAFETMDKLAQVANKNGATLEATATIYNRIGMAIADVGVNGNLLIGVVNAMQQTFRLSGASMAEATGATIQLSQGLASGQLRGQELRSVLESNVVIGGILAKQLNTTRGSLLKYAEAAGGIKTKDVLISLAKESKNLEEQTAKLGYTFEQTLNIAMNNFTVQWNKFNAALGVTSNFNKFIMFISENATPIIIAFGVALASIKWAAITTAVKSLAVGFVNLAGPLGIILITGFTIAAAKVALFATAIYMAYKAFTDFEGYTGTILSIVTKLGIAFDELRITLLEVGKGIVSWLGEDTTGHDKKINGLKQEIKERKKLLEQIELMKKSDEEIAALGERDILAKMKGSTSLNDTYQNLNENLEKKLITFEQYTKRWKKLQVKDADEEYKKGNLFEPDYKKKIDEIMNGKPEKNAPSKKQEERNYLADLNKQFKELASLTGGDFTGYILGYDKIEMDKLNKSLNDGSISIMAFNKELREMETLKLTRDLNKGSISFSEFTAKTNELKQANLKEEFQQGAIGLREFYVELNNTSNASMFSGEFFTNSFKSGLAQYTSSIKSAAEEMADIFSGAFKQMEDDLVKFVQTGKISTRDLSNFIQQEITRMLIRQTVMKPLEGLLAAGLGALSSGGTSTAMTYNYQPTGGTRGPYAASGTIINSPSILSTQGGRNVIGGEAGPEAVLPLGRNSQGDLGIKASVSPVVINISNSSSAEITTSESTGADGSRTIEVMIQENVKSGLASGAFDKQFKQVFGLNRKGF